MRNPRLANRYAKSLIDIAQEQDAMDAVLADMERIGSACKVSRDFALMLRSPLINGDKKISVMHAVFGEGTFHRITEAFINLLMAKGREVFLEEITSAYIAQYKDAKSINTVRLTTAVPLTEAVQKQITDKIMSTLDGKLDLHATVDPDILGGFILEIKDKSFDASIRRDLNDIKKQFDHNLFVAKI